MRKPKVLINIDRLMGRLDALAQIGSIDGAGVCRLALSETDGQGRDLVCQWMRELGLSLAVDGIGNVFATRAGRTPGPAVVVGSHIDTVRTGGRYDGSLGVLAGLEVVAVLNEAQLPTEHPLTIAFFSNEEGARFAPDMMGSMVSQGHLPLQAMLDVRGIDGVRLGDALQAIGYCGDAHREGYRARAYLELHIEQGPVLEREAMTIGAVEGVQGISWTAIEVSGVSNHAGTTPMSMRHDAGYVASAIGVFVRDLAREIGAGQVGTVGRIELEPNLVNVIARKASLTVDLRNADDAVLREAEHRLYRRLAELAEEEQVSIEHQSLTRFEPVRFSAQIVDSVERIARQQGHRVRRMPSGAGHDAQAFAPNCPTGMIFVPSVGGISHNVTEHTEPDDIAAGANVLLQLVRELCG